MRVLGLVPVWLMGSVAWAADCPTPYTIDGLLGDLTDVEVNLRDRNDTAAAEAGLRLRDGLGCLEEILPAPIASRAYRAVGAGLYAGGDSESANKWLRTSLELEPTWEYGIQDIPEGHPLRPDFEALKLQIGSDPVVLEGKEFGPGSHYLDGRKITSPRARAERFHVYQVDGSGVHSHIIEGNAFPAEQLVAAAVAAGSTDKGKGKDKTKKDKPPKERNTGSPSDKQLAKAEKDRAKQAAKAEKATKSQAKTRVAADGTVYYDRVRPKEKTPLMIAGGVVMASAAAIYYASSRTRSKMLNISTVYDVNPNLQPGDPFQVCRGGQTPDTDGCQIAPRDEVERLAGVTNRLVVASIAVFAVGAGATTWGVIVDGGTPMPAVNIRF